MLEEVPNATKLAIFAGTERPRETTREGLIKKLGKAFPFVLSWQQEVILGICWAGRKKLVAYGHELVELCPSWEQRSTSHYFCEDACSGPHIDLLSISAVRQAVLR